VESSSKEEPVSEGGFLITVPLFDASDDGADGDGEEECEGGVEGVDLGGIRSWMTEGGIERLGVRLRVGVGIVDDGREGRPDESSDCRFEEGED
jgi:hypothetical protein